MSPFKEKETREKNLLNWHWAATDSSKSLTLKKILVSKQLRLKVQQLKHLLHGSVLPITIKSINNDLPESAMGSTGNRRVKPLAWAGMVAFTGHVQLVKKWHNSQTQSQVTQSHLQEAASEKPRKITVSAVTAHISRNRDGKPIVTIVCRLMRCNRSG